MTDMDPPARIAPAAARNREPIAAVLRAHLPPSGLLLEIASGRGEHAMWFSRMLPGLQWQPTDRDPDALASIAAWRMTENIPNLLPPLQLDAAAPDGWPVAAADAVVAINMIHIAPWQATLGLLAGAARVLPPGGLLYLYGPFREAGLHTADSNAAFDRDLQARNAAWGVRDLESVAASAAQQGFARHDLVRMPANNLSVMFRRG